MGAHEELKAHRESMDENIQRLIETTKEEAELIRKLPEEDFEEARESIVCFIEGSVDTIKTMGEIQDLMFDVIERYVKL